MNFFLNIVNINCRIFVKNKTIVNCFRKELNYSSQKPQYSIEVIIRKNDHELEFIGRPLKIRFTIPYKKNINLGIIAHFMRSLLSNELLEKNILFFHASAVIKDDYACIFMGPSTAGKTTIMGCFDAKKRLADDTTIVKKINNNFFVYPSPFDLEMKIDAPKKCFPLKKMFLLKKNKETVVKKLNLKKQIVSLLDNSLSLPKINNRNDVVSQINKNLNKLYYKNIMALLGRVELNELHFKKDKDFISLI